jgi:hypothetical protein
MAFVGKNNYFCRAQHVDNACNFTPSDKAFVNSLIITIFYLTYVLGFNCVRDQPTFLQDTQIRCVVFTPLNFRLNLK